jgi:hypothetical protein
MNTFWGGPQQHNKYYKITSCSSQYYRYVNSLELYNESDGNPFAEPVQLYNNISNGYGIFAGASSVFGLIY